MDESSTWTTHGDMGESAMLVSVTVCYSTMKNLGEYVSRGGNFYGKIEAPKPTN